MQAQLFGTGSDDIARAARLLRSGALVAFPTETVYGLGTDATNGEAVAAVYAAKGRPQFNPLIVHVADIAAARALATFNDTAEKLASAFWPGPLSLVLPLRADHPLASLVTAGLDTVAVRVPAHPVAQALLRQVGPVAAPSANPSGKISPTRAAHVLDGLGDVIAAVLDGGPCPVGLESTIADPGKPATLLRPGGVSAEEIAETLGHSLAKSSGETITAPGQLVSHYAPDAKVRLNVTRPEAGEFIIGFGAISGDVTLSADGDLIEAAAGLFDALHMANESGRPIAVAPVPETGLGLAINDRLRRAAAPRGSSAASRAG